MKKINLLILMAIMSFIFSCRTELTNETDTNITQSDFRKTIKLKEALAFKTYITGIKNGPPHTHGKTEDFFSSLPDDATVTVITQHNVTSYSTIIRNLDRSSDVLVYSIDNENKSIGFIAKYKPADLTKNYQIDNFTGTVEYTTLDGRPMGTKELSNGTPLPDKATAAKTFANKIDCSLSIRLIEVECNGEHHTPSEYSQCTASEKPYYVVEITEVCPSGGQPPKGFPNMGMYDGGDSSGNSGTTTNEMSIQDSFNYMLNEAGFSELSAEEYTYIQNNQYIGGQLLSYFYNNLNQNNTQLLHWSINYFKNEVNSNISSITAWKEFEKWLNWYSSYILSRPLYQNYYTNHIDNMQFIFFNDIDITNTEDFDMMTASADIVADILINQQNGTLSNLDISWPNLETLKQKVKNAISKGVYTTAKYTRNYLYLPMYKLGVKYPSTVYWSNKAIDKIRIEAVTPMVNFNENTMGWGDLFNIWLFELTPSHFSNNTINFTNASNVVNGNNIYNPATNAVKNFPKGNDTLGGSLLNIQSKLANGLGIGQTAQGYFKYDVNAFYSTLANANIGIQMIGSYPIYAKVLSKSSHSAVVQFTINNDLGWESGTRFVKGENGGSNQGVIPNKPVGTGIHLGGTITNTYIWTETISF